ncbi:MAG: dynamin family protein [Succinivibrionaceae bacterium]|nr:dynamin family protein [Succinivibrionaceae bacterium]MDY6335524.1 dynamin family protein [Succinivibrionaceae bacterium]
MEHTATFERYQKRASRLLELRQKYGLPGDALSKYISRMDHFQVVAPLIGEFSTGKSSLVNALLGRSVLSVNITPETAVPTEICYSSDEHAVVFGSNGGTETISVDEFQKREFSVDKVKKVQLYLNNAFLREISSVKLVDMPGFNSGIELHSRAIDEYLPDAEAYILLFSARSSTISSDMAGFLKELHLHGMPVFLLISKSRAVTEDELRICVERIRADAAKYLGLADVPVGVTNAKGHEQIIEPLQDDLRRIEADSQNIFRNDAKSRLQQHGSDLALYLETAIKRADLTPDELSGKIEEAKRKIESLKGKLHDAGSSFSSEVDECIAVARSRLQSALGNAAPSLADMLANHIDIRDRVSMLVRETVMSSIKNDFAPRVKKYRERIAGLINVTLNINTDVSLPEDLVRMDNMTKEVIKKALPAILSTLGFALSGAVGAVVVLALTSLLDGLLMKKHQDEKKRLAEAKIRNEVIPRVLEQASSSVRDALNSQLSEINEEVGKEAQAQVDAEEKALSDLRLKNANEKANRAESIDAMKKDLDEVRRIMGDAD